jgi:hypothetical protein
MKKQYSTIISLTENKRGIFSIDPIMGCASGMAHNKMGCYNDCYSAKSAMMYGYDFSKNVLRNFQNKKHYYEIISKIKKIDLPFIRMGSSGDPSENWEHTINICEQILKGLKDNQLKLFDIDNNTKQIVIITKHWNNLTHEQLEKIKKMNICINTSISAIDSFEELNNRLNQYNLLKNYCKSILRIVSFDFNKDNELGLQYSIIQNSLFKNKDVIDTVFRPSKGNYLIKESIIKVKNSKFLGKKILVSKFNKKAYTGNCKNCLELCGNKM